MPSSLENAIDELRGEIDSYNQGSTAQPADGSTEWYRLRAAVLGMAYLKRLQSLGIEGNPSACERIYQQGSMHFKVASPPPAPVIERERLPDGSLPTGVTA